MTAGNVGFEPATKSDFSRASVSKSLARDPIFLRFAQILYFKVRARHTSWAAVFPVLILPENFSLKIRLQPRQNVFNKLPFLRGEVPGG